MEQIPSPNKHQQTDSSIQEAEIDGMEWESDSEFHKSRGEAGGIKTGAVTKETNILRRTKLAVLVNSMLRMQELREVNRLIIVRLITLIQGFH